MKRQQTLSLLLLAIALSACATRAKYEEKVGTWLGHSESSLVSAWGTPSSVYQVNDNEKLISFVRKGKNPMGMLIAMMQGMSNTLPSGYSETTFYGNTAHTTHYGGYNTASNQQVNLNVDCKTTFTLINDRVINFGLEGNGCAE